MTENSKGDEEFLKDDKGVGKTERDVSRLLQSMEG